jgi:hypothetical protein
MHDWHILIVLSGTGRIHQSSIYGDRSVLSCSWLLWLQLTAEAAWLINTFETLITSAHQSYEFY